MKDGALDVLFNRYEDEKRWEQNEVVTISVCYLNKNERKWMSILIFLLYFSRVVNIIIGSTSIPELHK